jgi:small-conductance mechanosensitive channel
VKHAVHRPIIAALLALSSTMASAQAPDAKESVEADAEVPVAAIKIDGLPLFNVRGSTAFPAERRAAAISKRIQDAAADATFSPDDIRVQRHGDVFNVMAGKNRLMQMFQADAALESIGLSELAAVNEMAIRMAIERYRADRTKGNLERSALAAVVATLLFAAATWLALRGFHLLTGFIEARYRSRLKSLNIQSFSILERDRIWTTLEGMLRGVRILSMLVLVYFWVQFTSGLFPWTRAISVDLLDYVTNPLLLMARGFVDELPSIIFLILLFLVTRMALRLIRMFFDAVQRGSVKLRDFDPEWAPPTYRVIRIGVIAFALVIAYPYIPGSESDAFKGVSIFLGVLLSIGSSSLVSNIIAGYAITYRRLFKVGHRVRVGDVLGDVVEVRLQVTHLRSLKNEEVIIPNSEILNSSVTNYSTFAANGGVILHTTVGIGYETPWRQVEAMLLLAAARTAGLTREPQPFVLQTALGDFCITYEINAYCDSAQAMPQLYAALHRNILDVFNEYGVQIMTPAYEKDPDQPKLVPPEAWYAAPAEPAPAPAPQT